MSDKHELSSKARMSGLVELIDSQLDLVTGGVTVISLTESLEGLPPIETVIAQTSDVAPLVIVAGEGPRWVDPPIGPGVGPPLQG